MTTTVAALSAGSMAYKLVVAIEGVPYLLTTGTPSAALAAWTGQGWSSALGDVFVEVDNQSAIDPWQPLSDGGTCKLTILPDMTAGDVLGVMMHRTDGGNETTLTQALNRTDATINVASTTGFAASGEAHIGNECFAYTGKTATSFTGVTRGKYAPFAAATTVTRFAHLHRVGAGANVTSIAPIVSQYPRTWAGRWVGVWLHLDTGGTLNIRGEAQCIFAGRISEVRDDADTGATVVLCEHVLDYIKDFALLRDPWNAEADEGAFVTAGEVCTWLDYNGTSIRVANPLTAKVGANPSLAYEIEPGRYPLHELVDRLNKWLSLELSAGRLWFDYVFQPLVDNNGQRCSSLVWYSNAGAGVTRTFAATLSKTIGRMLGHRSNMTASGYTLGDIASSNTFRTYFSDEEPYKTLIYGDAYGWSLDPINTKGAFFDQTNVLPYAAQPNPATLATLPTGWGLFLIAGSLLAVGHYNGSNHLIYLRKVDLPGSVAPEAMNGWGFRYGDGAPVTIQQVVAIERSFADLLCMLFFSSGEAGYNGAPDAGIAGIGAPAGVMANLQTSAASLPAASSDALIYISKPTKLGELIGPELMLRRSMLVWRNQSLQFISWQAPTVGLAVAQLDETNKADPATSQISSRSASALTTSYMRNVVKIEHNRNRFTDVYGSRISFEDRTSIDDHGGMPMAITISAPSYYTTDPGNDGVFRDFLAFLPFFSRPVRLLTRSISPAHYESLAAGDIVTVTDAFARDPISGQRGITNRPGLVMAHRYNLGGADISGGVQPMVGEVTIALSETDRSELYSPAAELDSTANTGGFTAGYNAGTSTLRLLARAYSETGEQVDASRFAASQKIRIIEIDPTNPASPTTWLRTISTVSGNDITLTVALSSPAFSSTKRYRIYADAYSVVTNGQRINSFQADSATARINAGTLPANQYTSTSSQLAFTPYGGGEQGEVIPTAAYGADLPLDAGTDYALAINAEWMLDHHRATSSPAMLMTPVSYTSGTGTWRMLALSPIWLGRGPSAATRYLRVRVWFASVTGASVNVRVSLLRSLPNGTTNSDVNRPLPFADATWSTTSTAYIESSEGLLDASVVGANGWAYILIEGTLQCATRGLVWCQLTPRE